MSNEYLPEWKPWKVTAEELEKLREKDRTILDKFYLENLTTLKNCAIHYYNSRGNLASFYNVDDMVQSIYLYLMRLDFSNPKLFKHTLNQGFYYSAFGCIDSVRYFRCDTEARNLFFHTYTILDEPLFDDTGRTRVDVLPGGLSPYTELMNELERRRQDKLEADLELILRRIFTPAQYYLWSKGSMSNRVLPIIRRHSDELLQFLREHGTPERKLQGHIMTAEEERARANEKRARLAWEKEHLEELTPERRKEVKALIRSCESCRRNSEARNARARIRGAEERKARASV